MKFPKLLRPAIAVALCIAGFAVARITPYREGTVLLEAGGCRMVTDIIDKGNDETSGSVVLLHGLAANKKLMAYMARSFAEQNLRVFVPDLPGHGRTPGPFAFSRAESCAEAFTRQLITRRAIEPSRTVLAGHSMGGAIAVRLAAQIPVAGVIAVSPAPMSTRHGIARYLLPFENEPPAPSKTLVISGSWEPATIRETARELIEGPSEGANRYVVIPKATHVSLIFDPRAMRASQQGTAGALGLGGGAVPPSLLPLAGSLAGFVGILLLAGPFIRETLGAGKNANPSSELGTTETDQSRKALTSVVARALLETGFASAIAVAALRFWQPLSFVKVFDGGYFAGFLFVVGLCLLALRYRLVRTLWRTKLMILLTAGLAALLLHFLVSVWIDATITEAWLSWSRWERFPALLIAFLPYLAAEELLVSENWTTTMRFLLALALRGVAWVALLFAIFILHKGPILLLLLAPYFALFCILQLAGTQLVRRQTRSPAAAALFGAILLAGFCLVIFPVT